MYEETKAFALLEVSFDLSEKGFDKWRDVGSALFAYLRMLDSGGVPAHVFNDAAAVARLGWEYAEPTDPTGFVTSASGAMPFFTPDQYVAGPVLLSPGGEEAVRFLLSRTAKPADALATLTAKSLGPRARLTEPIYGTQYGRESLAREVSAWSKASPPAPFAAPPPNAFLPRSLRLKNGQRGAGSSAKIRPELMLGADGTRLHVLADRAFARPKAFAYFKLGCAQFAASPAAAVQSDLYQMMLADELQERTYDASLAGLSASAAADWQGLSLSLGGFDDRLPELLSLIARQASRS